MVDEAEDVDLLGNALSIRPRTRPQIASPMVTLKKLGYDPFGDVVHFARKEGKAVIWVGVECTPEISLESPKLPLFFKGLTWVDFRNKEPDPLKQLIWGITGVRS